MKSSNIQHPNSSEHPITEHQANNLHQPKKPHRYSSLRRGASLVVGARCLVVFSATSAFAQNYSIDWHTIDGGGGTSTGGVYSVSGTIGQPDAGGPMTGGSYSVTGGFWSFLSLVQTPGAPLLSIANTATNTVVVFWPSPSMGFTLQTNVTVGTTNWGNVTGISDNGTNKFVIVNPPTGQRFYRLFKP